VYGIVHSMMSRRWGFPSGDPTATNEVKCMINAFSDLWSLMTIFFTTTFLQCELYLGMIVFTVIMAAIYIFMQFFDKELWGIR